MDWMIRRVFSVLKNYWPNKLNVLSSTNTKNRSHSIWVYDHLIWMCIFTQGFLSWQHKSVTLNLIHTGVAICVGMRTFGLVRNGLVNAVLLLKQFFIAGIKGHLLSASTHHTHTNGGTILFMYLWKESDNEKKNFPHVTNCAIFFLFFFFFVQRTFRLCPWCVPLLQYHDI